MKATARYKFGTDRATLYFAHPLKLDAGDDLVFTPSDSNPSIISWNNTYHFGAASTLIRGLCCWPETAATGTFNVGTNPTTGSEQAFQYIRLKSEETVELRADHSTDDLATLSVTANATNGGYHLLTWKDGGDSYAVYFIGNTVYPVHPAMGSLDLGTLANPWTTIYYHALSDETCAYMGNYTLEKLYTMFSQIKPRDDGVLHYSEGSNKYYPHIDFNSLPEEFIWKATEDLETILPAYDENGQLIKKVCAYKKGNPVGIDRTVQSDALIAFVVKLYEQHQEIIQRLENLETA